MKVTIKSRKTGVFAEFNGMKSRFEIGKRMDGNIGLMCDGDFETFGRSTVNQKEEIELAIRATIADGQDRSVEIISTRKPMTEAEHAEFDASRKAIYDAMTINDTSF
jgi:hypothetical protein